MIGRGSAILAVCLSGCHLVFSHTSGDTGDASQGRDLAGRPDSEIQDALGPDRGAREAGPDQTPPLCPGGPTELVTHMSARWVIGQQDFVSTEANRGGPVGPATLARPLGIGVHDGRLYIADSKNHRVLVYHKLPTTDGAPADEVIGQPDFVSSAAATSAASFHEPQGLHVDGAGLAVAEWSNHRISFWPTASPYAATVFWGQPDGTTGTPNTGGVGASSLRNPSFVARAGSLVFVTDANNHRVLIFDGALVPITHQPALRVIGQPNASSSSSGAAPDQLNFPLGLASDGQRLAIVDGYNNRLLIFNAIPAANGASPDRVWGKLGTSGTTLSNPVGALSDGNRLFVSDRGNSRILVFNSWPSAGQAPDVVLGQPSFTAGSRNQCNCLTAGASTLNRPHFMAWDGCRLYVSDSENNRVLVY